MSEDRASRTCEVWLGRGPDTACGKPTAAAYRAMGGGWMALCAMHAPKHAAYTVPAPHGMIDWAAATALDQTLKSR